MNLRPILVSLAILTLSAAMAFAGPPEGLQSGEISGITLGEEDENSYKKVQNRTISKFNELEKQMLQLSKGGSQSIPNLDEYELNYLATTYLICSMQSAMGSRRSPMSSHNATDHPQAQTIL